MNLGAIFAMLLQIGVCGASDFTKPDGTTLRVIVCPVAVQSQPPEPPAAPPAEDMSKPPGQGKVDG